MQHLWFTERVIDIVAWLARPSKCVSATTSRPKTALRDAERLHSDTGTTRRCDVATARSAGTIQARRQKPGARKPSASASARSAGSARTASASRELSSPATTRSRPSSRHPRRDRRHGDPAGQGHRRRRLRSSRISSALGRRRTSAPVTTATELARRVLGTYASVRRHGPRSDAQRHARRADQRLGRSGRRPGGCESPMARCASRTGRRCRSWPAAI